MNSYKNILQHIDWIFFLSYLFLSLIGLVSIYSVEQASLSYFGIPFRCIKQFTWFIISISFFVVIININTQNYQNFAYVFYAIVVCCLIGTSFLGITLGGHSSWYKFKFIYIQPSEFAKIAIVFAISRYMSLNYGDLSKVKHIINFAAILLIPMVIILLQGDLGSVVVFCCFIIVAYRENFPVKWIIYLIVALITIISTLVFSKVYLIIATIFWGLICIGINAKKISNFTGIIAKMALLVALIVSVDLVIFKILKPHQQKPY